MSGYDEFATGRLPDAPVQCKNCGHKFSSKSLNPICSQCHRRDVKYLEITTHHTVKITKRKIR